MRAYTPQVASDTTIVDLAAIDLTAILAEALNTAALAGDRLEVNRLMRLALASDSDLRIGRPNDHAEMRNCAQ